MSKMGVACAGRWRGPFRSMWTQTPKKRISKIFSFFFGRLPRVLPAHENRISTQGFNRKWLEKVKCLCGACLVCALDLRRNLGDCGRAPALGRRTRVRRTFPLRHSLVDHHHVELPTGLRLLFELSRSNLYFCAAARCRNILASFIRIAACRRARLVTMLPPAPLLRIVTFRRSVRVGVHTSAHLDPVSRASMHNRGFRHMTAVLGCFVMCIVD